MTLRTAVWQALGTVLDPELDEPITDLGFVASCEVDAGSAVHVQLRLPTFFCAPNFSYLMVADAHDAVSAVPGVTAAVITLADHHAAAEINGGVAAQAGFVRAFAGEADAELDELRAMFLTKAVQAGQHRVAAPLVADGLDPSGLAGLTLGQVPPSPDLQRLRDRRAQLGIPTDDDAPLLMHPDGSRVTPGEVPLHLRRIRLQRVGIETNAEYCTQLLELRPSAV